MNKKNTQELVEVIDEHIAMFEEKLKSAQDSLQEGINARILFLGEFVEDDETFMPETRQCIQYYKGAIDAYKLIKSSIQFYKAKEEAIKSLKKRVI